MIRHNPAISRIELNHGSFAGKSEVEGLKRVLALEKTRTKSTRAVLRVLTDDPSDGLGFSAEACVRTGQGTFAIFGSNSRSRKPDESVILAERRYIARVLASNRRPPPGNLEIVRLEARGEIAAELEALFSRTYKHYPVPLDQPAILKSLSDCIPYAVLKHGRIISALFGSIFSYGPLTAVEFTLSATKPAISGIGMTTALAGRIRAEAAERFASPLMVAETIAAPVMRSCHDLGMEPAGLLPEHYNIAIGQRTYTNFYAWFL